MVGRLLDGDRVARIGVEAKREGDALARAVAEHDRLGPHQHPGAAQPRGQHLAQTEVALGPAVAEERGPAVGEGPAERAAEGVDGEVFRVGHQGVEAHQIAALGIAGPRAVELEQAIHGGRERRRLAAPRCRLLRAAPAHEGAAPDPRVNDAFGRQGLVGEAHGVAVHVEARRELANRRQPGPLAEHAVRHRAPDLLGDLVVDRSAPRLVPAEGDLERGTRRLAKHGRQDRSGAGGGSMALNSDRSSKLSKESAGQ